MESRKINYNSLVNTLKLLSSGNHFLNNSIFFFFMRACELCELDICDACIDAGVDINIVDSIHNQTLLMPMINSGTLKLEVAQWLISKGIDINRPDVFLEHTPLSLACYKGNFELVKLLIQNSAKLESYSKNLLWWTVNTNVHNKIASIYNIVELLLDIGVNVDCDNPDEGSNPFISVVLNRHSQIAELFLKHGVSPNQYSNKGRTPLHIAVQNRDTKTARVLLEYHANVNAPLKHDCTLVFMEDNCCNSMDIAIEKGDTNMQDLLAAFGGEASKKN